MLFTQPRHKNLVVVGFCLS